MLQLWRRIKMQIKIVVENTNYEPVEDKRATIFIDGEKKDLVRE